MSLLNATIGPNAPATFNTVIEIPRGSTNKYEVDIESGLIKLDRVLYSPLFYPFDYGYIPQTKYLDGDPLDVLVLISHPTFPGCVIEASAIGVLEMTDEKGPDEKILCVATKDPRFGYRKTLEEVNTHTTKEIMHFFRVYKDLEDKAVEVVGWHGPDVARRLIDQYRLDR
ncbi:inorganic diphosphatase [Fimbriimonas ginsengisoli]|uniref:Inorganic pyrophosphatase n=1 Tax=Fimbriimonas ginsengisoli Gsoil 348 TaxID=661478 RepID=A0A068NZ24_FIMGI|nr:inorganic diphosphatase [Fimbriimonas ginsengisoli]AIE87829.1 Inorganic pyrophosphatase [Fimbriimonas ginsengisoli Gsoil 348]